MNKKRTKALILGGVFGISLGVVSLVALAYFPKTELANIGFMLVSPIMYASLEKWQLVVVALTYLGIIFSVSISLLLSINKTSNRIATAFVIIGSISFLHIIYAQLFFSSLFEAIGSEYVAEAYVNVLNADTK